MACGILEPPTPKSCSHHKWNVIILKLNIDITHCCNNLSKMCIDGLENWNIFKMFFICRYNFVSIMIDT